MSNEVLECARRIKELREISGISPETLAQELDLPVQEYVEYESGQRDLPIGFICKVAARFKVDVWDILAGDNPKLHTYAITRKGKGKVVQRRPEYKYQSIAHNFHGKKIEPFMVTVEPVAPGTPCPSNSHKGHEFDFIVEGTMRLIMDGKELILNEGDSIYFDSSYMHGIQAVGDKPVKFIAIVMD